MGGMTWVPGDVIVERQVWHGIVTAAVPAVVIEADDSCLISYIAPGAPFWFPADPVQSSPSGRHPWFGRAGWEGHGKLTITPAAGHYAVSHFWQGEDRLFACWYLNIQEPMRPTAIGFDSQDLELDIVVSPDRTWQVKDDDVLDQRVSEGRWTIGEVARIRDIGARIIRDVLELKDWWWDDRWADWRPDPSTTAPSFPKGWTEAPVAPFDGLLA